jgi:uncharacterized membrane protein
MEADGQAIADAAAMIHISKSVTVMKPRAEVYSFWRQLERLPSFMIHLHSVNEVGKTRSHWVANGPGGTHVEWDAEIVAEREHELLSWRSLEGSEIQNEGSVRFADAPADRGTEVRVELSYDAPGGAAGKTIAKWFGEEPGQQLTDDLRRFKQVMETGEVVLSDGSLQGAGEGATAERPAQAPEVKVRA